MSTPRPSNQRSGSGRSTNSARGGSAGSRSGGSRSGSTGSRSGGSRSGSTGSRSGASRSGSTGASSGRASGRTSAGSAGGRGRQQSRAQPSRAGKPPATAAARRAAEVKANRPIGPKRPRSEAPPERDAEEWIDDGPLQREAERAVGRARGDAPTSRRRGKLDPTVVEQVREQSPAQRAARHEQRLLEASDALARDRFVDARRLAQQVVRELPELALGHEIIGLASYRLGEWRKAATALELARSLEGGVRHHAVLADCYRAMRRYDEVEELWREVRESSPHPALMAEARIVAAGARADRGDLAGALATMGRVTTDPKRVRDYHLRQWYVLGDLYDRAGDPIAARRWFRLVAETDADFVDVVDRLRALGR